MGAAGNIVGLYALNGRESYFDLILALEELKTRVGNQQGLGSLKFIIDDVCCHNGSPMANPVSVMFGLQKNKDFFHCTQNVTATFGTSSHPMYKDFKRDLRACFIEPLPTLSVLLDMWNDNPVLPPSRPSDTLFSDLTKLIQKRERQFRNDDHPRQRAYLEISSKPSNFRQHLRYDYIRKPYQKLKALYDTWHGVDTEDGRGTGKGWEKNHNNTCLFRRCDFDPKNDTPSNLKALLKHASKGCLDIREDVPVEHLYLRNGEKYGVPIYRVILGTSKNEAVHKELNKFTFAVSRLTRNWARCNIMARVERWNHDNAKGRQESVPPTYKWWKWHRLNEIHTRVLGESQPKPFTLNVPEQTNEVFLFDYQDKLRDLDEKRAAEIRSRMRERVQAMKDLIPEQEAQMNNHPQHREAPPTLTSNAIGTRHVGSQCPTPKRSKNVKIREARQRKMASLNSTNAKKIFPKLKHEVKLAQMAYIYAQSQPSRKRHKSMANFYNFMASTDFIDGQPFRGLTNVTYMRKFDKDMSQLQFDAIQLSQANARKGLNFPVTLEQLEKRRPARRSKKERPHMSDDSLIKLIKLLQEKGHQIRQAKKSVHNV